MSTSKKFDFSWQFKNFEIRALHQNRTDKSSSLQKNCPIELVKYFSEEHNSCYVVAYFAHNEEGYELHFVGNRPFKDISPNEMKSIWRQLQAAQKMLDAYHEACQDDDDN